MSCPVWMSVLVSAWDFGHWLESTTIIDGFINPWSPPSRLWGCATEGKRKGREGLVLRSPRPKGRRRINSLPQHFVVRHLWGLRRTVSKKQGAREDGARCAGGHSEEVI